MAEALSTLAAKGLLRNLRTLSSGPDPWVEYEGRRLLHLASNNYLGLATEPRVVEAAAEAARRYGAGAGASRLMTGHTDLHAALEADLAAWKGTEAALVFPTGFAANLGVLTALAGPRDAIFADALNHASLIDGARLCRATVRYYRHGDLDHLEHLIRKTRCRGRRLIVTDGVFSMDGDLAPLPGLVEIAERHEALLVVDDAHGTGVLGPDGAGTAAHFGLSGRIPVQIGTLSKALGAQGGFVAGSRELIDYLINRARPFIYSTGIAPPVAAAARTALALVRQEPERRARLRENARWLRQRLQAMGLRLVPAADTPILAVLIGEAEAALAFSQRLLEAGVLVPAVRPPAVPPGTSRLRVSVMATHTAEDLAMAAEAFARAAATLARVTTTPVRAGTDLGGGAPPVRIPTPEVDA